MKQVILSLLFAVVLISPSFAQEKKSDEMRDIQQKVNAVREEINRLHFLAALELTLEQAKELKILLDGVKLARELLNEKMMVGQKETLEILEKIRDSMAENGEEPSAELVEKYHELRKETNRAGKEFQESLVKADREINGLLTEEQRKLVETYSEDPLAPPGKDAPDEGEMLAQIAKLIDRLKQVPVEQLDQFSERVIQQFMGRFSVNRQGPRPDSKVLQRKIGEIAEKARVMDDFEYMLWREEFAKQLFDLVNKPPKREALKNPRDKGPELSKAGELFLDEGMLAALERRIAILEKTSREEQPEKEKTDKE